MKAFSGPISWLRLCALGALGTLGTLLSGLSVAQSQQASAPSSQLEEVVVTAQYREEKLQDTPIAITAFTSQAIEEQGAQVLSDILGSAPSVNFRPTSAAFGESVSASIRGFGQVDFDPAFEPGVGMYIDDVYYPRLTGANFDLLDVERVEVLRGPQGTLYGKDSEGGSIRFVSRKPTGDGPAYISGTYGSKDRLDLIAGFDFTLADHLTGRLSGTYKTQEGYVNVYSYGCVNPDSGVPAGSGGLKCQQYSLGDTGYHGLRGLLRYNPTASLDILFSADYIHDAHNNGAEVLLYGNNPNPNTYAPNGGAGIPLTSAFICGKWCNYTTLGKQGGNFTIAPGVAVPVSPSSGGQLNTFDAYDFALNADIGITDGVKAKWITGYRNWTNTFSIDGDLSPAQTQFGNNTLTDWFWSQELRLSMDFTPKLRATIGGFYSDEKTTYYTLQDIRYAPIPLQFLGNDPVKTTSKAAFGTLFYDLTDALSLTGGARYSWDDKSYTYYRLSFDGVTPNPFLGALNGLEARFQGSRPDWHVSADYRFNPAVMTYVSWGTGYKAGGDSPRPFNPAQAIGFGPEKVNAYEIGLKTDLFDRTVRFNTAVFYNKLDDAQLVLLELSAIRRSGTVRAAAERRRRGCHGRGSRDLCQAGRGAAARCVGVVHALGLEMRGPAGGAGPGARCHRLLEQFGGDRSAFRYPARLHQGAGAPRRPVSVPAGRIGHADAALRRHVPRSPGRQQHRARAGFAVRGVWAVRRLHAAQRPPDVAQCQGRSRDDARRYEPHQPLLLLLEVRPDRGRRGHHHRLAGATAAVGADDEEELLIPPLRC